MNSSVFVTVKIILNTENKNTENTIVIPEKVKKPRKPLSEESKNKRREVLKRAREAKLTKLKVAKETGQVPIKKEVITVKPTVDDINPLVKEALKDVKVKKQKTEEQKIMKKVNKKLQIESIIEEKLAEKEKEREIRKQEKERQTQQLRKQEVIKNLF